MQFDRLYNLILQSILTQDIQNKIRKAIQTLIKSGQLQSENDPRAQQVKTIIKRNSSIDINGKTKLDQLLKANQKYTTRAEVAKDNYLDSIKQFSQKETYDNGVVIYKIEQSKAGMNAVRKIVDIQWGTNSKPWCLITRPMDKVWDYWKAYSAYPKHIAFQNGKLLAFSANRDEKNLWWDRNDNHSNELILLDGSKLQTKEYSYSGDTIEIFIKRNRLVLNQQTQRYDSQEDVTINDSDLINGHFPIKFGKVKGSFNCWGCTNLISLKGAPQYVGKGFTCSNCSKLTSLKGAPQKVDGYFNVHYCFQLKSLQGSPEEVGDFCCKGCEITSLKGAPKIVHKGFDCSNCLNLESLQGAPKEIGGDFNCKWCPKLKITKQDRKKYKING